MANEWDFVQKYYPNYHKSDAIAENDDLHKICDGEINGYAEQMYNDKITDLKELFNGTLPEDELKNEALKHFEALKNESDADIFRQSILSFIELTNKTK